MLARKQPADAYREANFDARLMGGTRDDLVIFCIEDLIANLGALEFAEARSDRASRSKALTRCVTALTALELGIDREAELATSLLQFYGAAKASLLDSVRETDLAGIATLKQDFRDIAMAMKAARSA
ncbi:MAG: flagellar protein FliS [Alphaproteobacteria bacterium]|nr:flagellar protein FliS [Alphaproteobacteria bacterium]MBU1756357.1 flagellar protein FliS [Alphaproteobacteria bacterium]